ncbi:uncharacterized protein F5891DRAFT_39765 [Suillus fuscotomentosus]|uniref:G protein-coupled receptor n=1 Tax=Suillus fuscotomentosus TaxID=1912939 RepID=A0AAD4EDK5_9AGAM|nr:uncharacterized protein F5891DRAFT_39765 [Suillus fuscotomentosus]KAG1904298.1 hypothetical protein F5891DRAFT_39765 [Suillus fuscotomentosus]
MSSVLIVCGLILYLATEYLERSTSWAFIDTTFRSFVYPDQSLECRVDEQQQALALMYTVASGTNEVIVLIIMHPPRGSDSSIDERRQTFTNQYHDLELIFPIVMVPAVLITKLSFDYFERHNKRTPSCISELCCQFTFSQPN